jgi:hypothetical protein
MGEITLDKFLSFWIVLYSVGYVLKIFPYNPIVLLGISIIVFAGAVIIALYYHNKNSNLFYYFMINFFGKIPIFILIYNNNPGMKHSDIIFSVLIVLIYILYIKAVGDDILCVYRDLLLFIINKEEGREGPFYKYYKNLSISDSKV